MKRRAIVLILCLTSFFALGQELQKFKSGNKWGLKDSNGKTIVKAKYSRIGDFSDGLASVLETGKMGKYGYIDKTGAVIIPFKYNVGKKFSEGLAAVKLWKNGREVWGFIDITGKEVIPLIYHTADDFSGGFARIMKTHPFREAGVGFVDKQGKERIYEEFGISSGNLTPIKSKQGKWGYVNSKGEEVIPPMYDKIDRFKGDLTVANIGERWVYLDTLGIVYNVTLGSTIEVYSTAIGNIETYRHPSKVFNGVGVRTTKKEPLLLPYYQNVTITQNAIVCKIGTHSIEIDIKNLAAYEVSDIKTKGKRKVNCTSCFGEGKIYTAGNTSQKVKEVTKYRSVTSYETKWNPATKQYDGYKVEKSVPYQVYENKDRQSSGTAQICADCKGAGYLLGKANSAIFWDGMLFKYDLY
ncbi:WG repeat-containing protein [Pedobacter sp.]